MKEDGSQAAWFLSFLNVELEKQAAGDILKLVLELDAVLKGGHYRNNVWPAHLMRLVPKYYVYVNGLMANQYQKVKDLQKALGEFVEDIIKAYDKAKKHADTTLSEDEFTSLSALCRVKITLGLEARMEAPTLRGVVDGPSVELVSTYEWDKKQLDEATCRLVISSENLQDLIKYLFLESFKDVPLKALRKCPMCQNLFLHLSKREREFCSNRCAAKNISRKRYVLLKQEPSSYQEELDKKSDKNHDFYKRSVQKTHPNADIKRRPRRPNKKED